MSSCPHGGSTACTVCAKEAYLLSVRFSPANLDRLEKLVGELEIQAIHNKNHISALEKVVEAAVAAWEADQIGRMEPYDKRLSGALDDLEEPLRAAGYLGEGDE